MAVIGGAPPVGELIALGAEAGMNGYRVRCTLATKLINELVQAADDKQLTKTIAYRPRRPARHR
jgi:hypothetical protein